MNTTPGGPFHKVPAAHLVTVNGVEMIGDYRDLASEYAALKEKAAVLDFSARGRICLTGNDRVRFLHGQVTNDIKSLKAGTGCYAALTTAKGKIQADMNIYQLGDELLLDFEPGLTQTVSARLDQYIVADEVQIVDVAPLYALLSIQGPKSGEAVARLGFSGSLPQQPFDFLKLSEPGEVYVMNQPRIRTHGFDFFVPMELVEDFANRLLDSAKSIGGGLCGWEAFEIVRVEKGVPRFPLDMDETNFPQECGIDKRAVSYTKGCYIGQEVLNRIHTLGHVNKALTSLRFANDLTRLPVKGDMLYHSEKEAGYVTSAIHSPEFDGNIGLGYVRNDVTKTGTQLQLCSDNTRSVVEIIPFPE